MVPEYIISLFGTFRDRYRIVIRQFPEFFSCAKYMIKRSWNGLFHIRSPIRPWSCYQLSCIHVPDISGPRADKGSDMKKAMW